MDHNVVGTTSTNNLDNSLQEYEVIKSDRFSSSNSSTNTTTVHKTGAGFIHQIRVLGGVMGNVTVYDNTEDSGTTIIPTVTPAQGNILVENVVFAKGLTIVTEAKTVLVVSYG